MPGAPGVLTLPQGQKNNSPAAGCIQNMGNFGTPQSFTTPIYKRLQVTLRFQ